MLQLKQMAESSPTKWKKRGKSNKHDKWKPSQLVGVESESSEESSKESHDESSDECAPSPAEDQLLPLELYEANDQQVCCILQSCLINLSLILLIAILLPPC
jgi:hypothetical protein